MSKAENQNIDRRRVIKGAALASIGATLTSVPAVAAASADPHMTWMAEYHNLRKEHDALSARIGAIYHAYKGDLGGCGWPPLDTEGQSLRVPGKIGESVHREIIEIYNASVRNIVAGFRPSDRGAKASQQIEDECAARLAWWDRRQAEREHNAEVSGYRALVDQAEVMCDRLCDLLDDICRTPATTLQGAMCRLEAAAIVIRDDNHSADELEALDIDEAALIGALNDLRRILPERLADLERQAKGGAA